MTTEHDRTSQQLEQEKEKLLLDMTQFLLDVIGIFEPTPIADSANAIISLKRKDWLGAGLSEISILPFLGDLAKIGKLPRYSRSINKAMTLAKSDANFADRIRPLLQRLKHLLDDVPLDEIPGSLSQIRRRIGKFLKGSPWTSGPVTQAMQSLPASLKSGFKQAMKLPPIRNPRRLRKRPGPVHEDNLLSELSKKGFTQIKTGSHNARKLNDQRRAVEDSDVYIRRILGGNGQQYFETIRIDRKFGGGTSRPFGRTGNGLAPSPGARRGVKSAADVQGSDKQFRRIHNTLESTSSAAGKALGGGRSLGVTGRRRMVNDLQAGSKKGEFSHWHNERIPATPESLARYLQRPLKKGQTQKFDDMGQLVGTF
jgi:hypothetical protein